MDQISPPFYRRRRFRIDLKNINSDPKPAIKNVIEEWVLEISMEENKST